MNKHAWIAAGASALVVAAAVIALVSGWNPLGDLRADLGTTTAAMSTTTTPPVSTTNAPAKSRLSDVLSEEFRQHGYNPHPNGPEVVRGEKGTAVHEVWAASTNDYRVQLNDGQIRVVAGQGMWCSMPNMPGATLSLSDALAVYEQASAYFVSEGALFSPITVNGVTTANAVVDFAGRQWTVACYAKPVIE
ncbi:MAG TPA: hypothetical protein VFZ48_03910 [Candidatus Saccharimonadales bacterium]